MAELFALFSAAFMVTVFLFVLVLPLVLITAVLAVIWKIASFCLHNHTF